MGMGRKAAAAVRAHAAAIRAHAAAIRAHAQAVRAHAAAVRAHAADVAFGALALSLGAAALIWYGAAGDGALRALLWPHAKAAEAFYHATLRYQDGVGYVAADGGFAIGQGCMGMNFIVMLFCLMACAYTRRFRGARKAAFFVLSLAGSAAVGVLVSCIRIIGSVPLLSSSQFTALHAGTGATLYLAALASIYALVGRATGGFHEKHP